MSGGWRPTALVREAVRNVADLRGPLGTVVLLAVATGSALGWFAVDRREALGRSLAAEELAGTHLVVVATPPNATGGPTRIERASCERLGPIVGGRAGLVADRGTDRFVAFGSTTHVLAVSPQLVGFGTRRALAGVTIGGGHGLRRVRGERLGPVDIAPLPQQPDGVELNTSLVAPLDATIRSGPVCAVMLPALSQPASLLSLLQARLDTDGSTGVAAVPGPSGDAVVTYRRRVERWFPVAAGAFIAIVVGIVAARRQSELAAYRLSGTSRRALMTLLQLEAVVVAGLLWAAAAVALAAHGPAARDVVAFATAVVIAPLTVIALVPVLVLRVACRDAFSLAKAA